MKDYLQMALLAAVLYFLAANYFDWGYEVVSETVKTETKIDTVYKVIERVIIKEPIVTKETHTISVPVSDVKELPQPITEAVSKNDTFKIDLPVNEYRDTLEVDGATLSYKHLIAGYLQSSDYAISYPKETITETITKTKIRKRIIDVYAIGGYTFGDNAVYGGVDVALSRFKIGYRVKSTDFGGVTQVGNSVEIGYKLFGL